MTHKDTKTILLSMHDILNVTREHKFKDPNGRNALDYHSNLYRARQLIAEMVTILDREINIFLDLKDEDFLKGG